jgi:hypothetical protein
MTLSTRTGKSLNEGGHKPPKPKKRHAIEGRRRNPTIDNPRDGPLAAMVLALTELAGVVDATSIVRLGARDTMVLWW